MPEQPKPVRRQRLGADFSLDDSTEPAAAAPSPAPEPDPAQAADRAPASKPASRKASRTASKGASADPDMQAERQAELQADRQAEVGEGTVPRAQLLRGRRNPYRVLGQAGVRTPPFIHDAVRAVVNLSHGETDVQRFYREAVEEKLERDGWATWLEESWVQHGGIPGTRHLHRPV